MKFEDLENWEKPRMRLFFSADIIGSTAYKQPSSESNGSKDWFKAVLSFYHQAEQKFSAKWTTFSEGVHSRESNSKWFGAAPELWKTIGDEVLFTKTIEHPIQAAIACHVWIKTLKELKENLQEERGLDVKSTAWVAGFPQKNQEIFLKREKQNNFDDEEDYIYRNYLYSQRYYEMDDAKKEFIVDFIGPSIDNGFRLSSLASSRKFVISLELAKILSHEQSSNEKDPERYSLGAFSLNRFDFRYDGRKTLKGVFNGSAYPVFWIDLSPLDPTNSAEDSVLNISKPTAQQIDELTTAFFNNFKHYINKPFFFENNDFHSPIDGYDGFPAEYLESIQELRENIKLIKQKRFSETESENAAIQQNTDELNIATPEIIELPRE